jgi:hypothetical protein
MGKIIEVLHYYMLAIKYVPVLSKIKPTKQYTDKIRHHKRRFNCDGYLSLKHITEH